VKRKGIVAAVVAAILLAGCALDSPPPAPPVTPAFASSSTMPTIYVANLYSASAVIAYSPSASLPNIRYKSELPCEHPSDMAVSAQGVLATADRYCRGGRVEIYSTGNRKPDRVLQFAGVIPASLTFDAAGNLYVTESTPQRRQGVIVQYAHGDYDAVRTISDGICAPMRPFIDSSGTLFVANQECGHGGAGSISEYRRGQTKPFRTIDEGVNHPDGIALDQTGNIYLVQFNNNSVPVYGREGRSPIRILHPGTARGRDGPIAIAFDSQDRVFIATTTMVLNGGSIAEYSSQGRNLLRKIANQVQNPSALAFDEHDNLYVADMGPAAYDNGWISMYASNANTASRILTAGVATPIMLALSPKSTDVFIGRASVQRRSLRSLRAATTAPKALP
jgi:DNA-binding beta-propeller fold protein YncE